MSRNNEIIYLPPQEIQIQDDPGYGLGSRQNIHTIAGRLVEHYKGKINGGWNSDKNEFVSAYNQGDLRPSDALYATQYSISRGLNPFGDVHLWYYHEKLTLTPHWRILKGWAELIAPFGTKSFRMTDDEREQHNLALGDLGVIAYNILDSAHQFYQKMTLAFLEEGLTASEARRKAAASTAKGTGVGIVLAAEMKNRNGKIAPPKGRSWDWRCGIRAFRDAVGKSHGDPPPAQIKAFAQGHGIGITSADMPALAEPIMSELKPPEQRRYLELNADLRKAETRREAMTPDELAAQSQRHINLMRGSEDDCALGEEPEREEISDGVIEEETQPAPSVSTGSTNGAGQATVGGGFDFRTWANHLGEACPRYAKDGQPDMVKILAGAWELGHQTITEANVADVMTALSDAAGDAPMPQAVDMQAMMDTRGDNLE